MSFSLWIQLRTMLTFSMFTEEKSEKERERERIRMHNKWEERREEKERANRWRDEQSSPSSPLLSGHLLKNTAEPATLQFALEFSETHTHTHTHTPTTVTPQHYSITFPINLIYLIFSRRHTLFFTSSPSEPSRLSSDRHDFSVS